MKKILFGFIFICVFSSNVFAADYFFVGVDCFNKGVYDKAASNLEHAVKINPKNVNARYYLAQVYLKQNRINDAKTQYDKIIVLAPASKAALLSQKGLSFIRQAEMGITVTSASGLSNDELAKYSDNYLDYVLTSDGKIFKWASFPVTVYIEPKSQKDLAQKAFKQWQEKSNNLVSFKFVPQTAQAQITVDFKDKLETDSGKESYIAGYSKPYYQGENIVKSEIHILDKNPDTGEAISDDFISFALLHEIGHSLGFKGHSSDEKDVMAPSATNPKTTLTQRDINTLNVFYKITPEVLTTRNKGTTDVQLQQALDYVKKTPDKAVGWSNLGDIYRSKKMYSDAIQNYQKAISIEPDKAETYNLLGATYLDMKDTKNAYTNLKKACDLDKSNVFYIYQFAKLCLTTGQKEIGKNYLNNFIKTNPESTSDEKIQSLLKQYQ